ncbi:hypothetical protein TrVE_jg2325 [Triparma verrucosa]|uniref:Uncharacterized protein n=1 Tax=Triparma verrucosa TaxID=1606542 RepID=A0A9W7FK07_9STRA|nr:hypothetical protein TrVE_jg2325 [Triparma verrucosa]
MSTQSSRSGIQPPTAFYGGKSKSHLPPNQITCTPPLPKPYNQPKAPAPPAPPPLPTYYSSTFKSPFKPSLPSALRHANPYSSTTSTSFPRAVTPTLDSSVDESLVSHHDFSISSASSSSPLILAGEGHHHHNQETDLSSSAESLESLTIGREVIEEERDKLLEELEIERALHAKTKEEHTMALVEVSSELRDLAIKQVMEAVAQHSTDLDERERAIQEKYDKRLKEQGKTSQERQRELSKQLNSLRDAEKALNQRLHEEKFVTMKHMKQSIKLTVQLERSNYDNALLRERLSMCEADLESREEQFYDPMYS